ncbi:hypothetical protein N7468_010338 [Penicillium chermesinum]|uniref:Uncharacterized protein n=1 Tax=Penicillium chermesinum TaxID=63820 RepID=A0A9W9NCI0_9EURO|nr:uncharacterized protein N7468_010338 [Penicillium chermesinum]KAJ5217330.1 hypothetical protein N7468_010338 [Penicillium chermesinum]KAJ6171058.1 hypothetical protein N7470_000125 [Penicillium chermesinum]
MRPSWWIGVWATFLPATVYSLDTKPFSEPQIVESKRAFEVLQLLKRADNCPGGYNPCSNEGNANACCREGTTCTKDSANNIACCSTGASCTGSLTGTATAPAAGGSSSGSFVFPQGATATPTEEGGGGGGGGGGAAMTGSTLPGAYPFVYVPTTISDSAECSSYYSLCQSEYAGCTQQLMGRYGVTVGGNGGGTTVEAITASSQATSICSSLSAEACHGLSLGYCSAVETGGGSAAGNNAAPPGRTSSLQDLAFGLMIGVAGMFV